MKLGILNAFPPEGSKIHWKTTPVDVYIDSFEGGQPPFRYAGYDVARGQFPVSLDDCDAYIISGSPRGAYDSDGWIAELSDFIRAAFQGGKKLVGICFGHQILAQALGGRVEKSKEGWGLGLKSFEIAAEKPWLTANSGQCSLYFVHQDQVIQLPPEAELLGGNEFCPNTLFVIGNQVLGIQGHPEFTPEIMAEILTALKPDIEPPVFEKAVQSVENGAPDNQIVAQWIVNFLAF